MLVTRAKIYSALFIALSLALAARSVHAAEATPRFEPVTCPLFFPAGLVIQCGFLVVPEDRTQAAGQTIRLSVAIIKSRRTNPNPDPLLVLNGGPGAHALTDLNRFLSIFHPWLSDQDRDVIIFDQRGVGLSEPALHCPELTPMLIRQAHGDALTLAETQAPYRACRDRWTEAGVNLSAYTTAASAADVNDLWHTLGYREVNLYGVSYGTFLAQTVMRDYPAGVRSVILDSAYPLESLFYADLATNYSEGLQRIFAACAAETLCHTLYPDPAPTLTELYTRLSLEPARLTQTDPVTNEEFSFTFSASDALEAVKNAPFRQVPALIYDLSEGNYSAILQGRREGLENSYRYGPPPHPALARSIFCSQGAFYVSPAQSAAWGDAPWDQWAKNYFSDLFSLPCDEWATFTLDIRPAQSAIPTLILIGQYDLSFSPRYIEVFQSNLSHAFLITAPNTGHGVLTSGQSCFNVIGRAFLADPAHAPDSVCLANVGRAALDTPFVTRAAAMRWPTQIGLALLSGFSILTLVTQARSKSVSAALTRPRLNWRMVIISAAVLGAGWSVAYFGWITVAPAVIVPLLVALLGALFGAFLFSPEDEPFLEVMLALPRPLAMLLAERFGLLLVTVSGVAVVVNLFTANEMWLTAISRWFAPLLVLTSLALCLTLITRRAIVSVALTVLVWFAAAAFGDSMVFNWPFTWPAHLFLGPEHAFYALNRSWLVALGVALWLAALTRLIRDEERLLLGARGAALRRSEKSKSVWLTLDGLDLSLPYPWPQMAAMARYEFLINWRRASFFVLTGALLTTPVLGALLELRNRADYANAASAELAQARLTGLAMQTTWGSVASLCLFLLPLLVADLFSKDHQWETRELLNSLPLSPGVYLLGKLISLWVSLTVCLACVALVSVSAWRIVGPFNFKIYGEMWAVGVWPLALITATLAALLAAGQITNRRAALVGIAVIIFAVIGQVIGYPAGEVWWNYWNPGRPTPMLYYLLGWPGFEVGQPASTQRLMFAFQHLTSLSGVWLTHLAGLLEVLAVGGVVWWKNFRD